MNPVWYGISDTCHMASLESFKGLRLRHPLDHLRNLMEFPINSFFKDSLSLFLLHHNNIILAVIINSFSNIFAYDIRILFACLLSTNSMNAVELTHLKIGVERVCPLSVR